jgi:hypothetical protein
MSETVSRIHQDSGNSEWYSPEYVIDAARAVLGGIDLDPASSEAANARIGATTIYTQADDGLSREWYGRVWMNHPFSREGNRDWPTKLLTEYAAGRVSAACMISYAATSEAWFKPLMAWPQCYLQPRTNYCQPDGSIARGVSKGSVVTYLGHDCRRFHEVFRALGCVQVPAAWLTSGA